MGYKNIKSEHAPCACRSYSHGWIRSRSKFVRDGMINEPHGCKWTPFTKRQVQPVFRQLICGMFNIFSLDFTVRMVHLPWCHRNGRAFSCSSGVDSGCRTQCPKQSVHCRLFSSRALWYGFVVSEYMPTLRVENQEKCTHSATRSFSLGRANRRCCRSCRKRWRKMFTPIARLHLSYLTYLQPPKADCRRSCRIPRPSCSRRALVWACSSKPPSRLAPRSRPVDRRDP